MTEMDDWWQFWFELSYGRVKDLGLTTQTAIVSFWRSVGSRILSRCKKPSNLGRNRCTIVHYEGFLQQLRLDCSIWRQLERTESSQS